jgi:hypothetical protein
MFNSRSDYDKCLKKNSFVDEVIILDLNGQKPEQIMTRLNNSKNNWRLCKYMYLPDNKCSFVKRTYFENAEIDEKKYKEYYESEVKPLLLRSNALIKKMFPDVLF